MAVDLQQRLDARRKPLRRLHAVQEHLQIRPDVLGDQPFEGPVLQFQHMRGMPRRLREIGGGVDFLNTSLENGIVDIAKALHLVYRYALGDQRLLRLGYLRSRNARKGVANSYLTSSAV